MRDTFLLPTSLLLLCWTKSVKSDNTRLFTASPTGANGTITSAAPIPTSYTSTSGGILALNPGSLTANPSGNQAATTYTGTGDPVLDGWCYDQYTSFLKASGTPSNITTTYTVVATRLSSVGSQTVSFTSTTSWTGTHITTLVPTPYVAPEECFNGCNIQAVAVRLDYWPTPGPRKSGSMTLPPPTPTDTITPAPVVTALVDGSTLYSPSVYLVFSSLMAVSCPYGGSECLTIGPVFENKTMSFESDELSTVNCYHQADKADYRDFNSPVAFSVVKTQAGCTLPQVLTATYALDQGVPDYELKPNFAYPPKLKTEIDPRWANCTFILDVYDPPSALVPAPALTKPQSPAITSIAVPVIPTPESDLNPPAQPSQTSIFSQPLPAPSPNPPASPQPTGPAPSSAQSFSPEPPIIPVPVPTPPHSSVPDPQTPIVPAPEPSPMQSSVLSPQAPVVVAPQPPTQSSVSKSPATLVPVDAPAPDTVTETPVSQVNTPSVISNGPATSQDPGPIVVAPSPSTTIVVGPPTIPTVPAASLAPQPLQSASTPVDPASPNVISVALPSSSPPAQLPPPATPSDSPLGPIIASVIGVQPAPPATIPSLSNSIPALPTSLSAVSSPSPTSSTSIPAPILTLTLPGIVPTSIDVATGLPTTPVLSTLPGIVITAPAPGDLSAVVTTLPGSTVTLAPASPSSPRPSPIPTVQSVTATIEGQTVVIAPDGGAAVVAGHSLTAGGTAVTVSNTRLSLGGGGIIIGTTTVAFATPKGYDTYTMPAFSVTTVNAASAQNKNGNAGSKTRSNTWFLAAILGAWVWL